MPNAPIWQNIEGGLPSSHTIATTTHEACRRVPCREARLRLRCGRVAAWTGARCLASCVPGASCSRA
eukprot:scaffold5340_cov131-Isochrysis_galbana.AAC.9